MRGLSRSIKRHRRQHRRNRKFIVILAGAVLVASLSHLFYKKPARPEGLRPTDRQEATVLPEKQREVYLYSVIPGGVDNAEELGAKLKTDKVAAHHYSDFKVDRAVLVYARFDQQKAYVSYRKDAKIFWTRKRVHVGNSEMLLTDGKNFARTRCGNRLSETPQKPTEANEPSEEALLYVPTFVSDRAIQLPADWETAPPLQVSRPFVFPAPGAILLFEEVQRPLRFVPLTVGVTNSVPVPVGNSPEPGTTVLLASGCAALAIFHLRRKAGLAHRS